MTYLNALKAEMNPDNYRNKINIYNYLMCGGYRKHFSEPHVIARAYAAANAFTAHKKHIYDNDLVVGSIVGKFADQGEYSEAELKYADKVLKSYGDFNFHMNKDHYAPDFVTTFELGIGGILDKIEKSKEEHKNDPDAEKKLRFLKGAEITMKAFSEMIRQYGDAAEARAMELSSPQRENLLEAAAACHKVAVEKPETFLEAIQLMWLIHISFQYEGRYAMALGRMDQFLYPYYQRDMVEGVLTEERAIELVSCTLFKIKERMLYS